MISVAEIGNTYWVCDPRLVSYALEQPEMLKSHEYKNSNVMYKNSVRPLYIQPVQKLQFHYLVQWWGVLTSKKSQLHRINTIINPYLQHRT